MINSCTSNHSHNYQELVDDYEKIRTEALDKSKLSSNHQSGFSILLFRGMATWIETCRYSQMLQIRHCHLNASDYSRQLQEPTFSDSIYKEATLILTNMVLSHQKQSRSNYA
jgi:hypothetical protein